MRWLKYAALIALVWVGSPLLAADDAWLLITPQDLQIKDVPGSAGAGAIQLYYADFIDEHDRNEFFYHRIKILNESGRHYADVEIPVFPGSKIVDLQARCIRPDGSFVEQAVTPFEKMIIKGHGVKFRAQTLVFPEVAIGSIVEYKYKVHSKESPDKLWLLEHELFTVKQRFLLKYAGTDVTFEVRGSKVQPKGSKGAFELEMSDVPAFQPEELMPPERDYKASVRFYHGAREAFTNMFWAFAAARLSSNFDHIIGQSQEIRDLALRITQGVEDKEESLRRLYAEAQKIRNLSYERERTEAEIKKEDLKENKSALDVLKHGYGNRGDITVLFVALARAAGFNSYVVMTTDRSESLYQKDHVHPSHYDTVIAAVKLNGKERFLDPGTSFCPFGVMRWFRTGSPALKLGGSSGTFFDLPAASAEDAFMLRTARMELDQQGRAEGRG